MSQSTESDKLLNTQRKRDNTKRSITSLEGTVPNINFNVHCIYSGTNISVPTEKVTKNNLYHNTYDDFSNLSESNFFLVQLNKRIRYSSKNNR